MQMQGPKKRGQSLHRIYSAIFSSMVVKPCIVATQYSARLVLYVFSVMEAIKDITQQPACAGSDAHLAAVVLTSFALWAMYDVWNAAVLLKRFIIGGCPAVCGSRGQDAKWSPPQAIVWSLLSAALGSWAWVEAFHFTCAGHPTLWILTVVYACGWTLMFTIVAVLPVLCLVTTYFIVACADDL